MRSVGVMAAVLAVLAACSGSPTPTNPASTSPVVSPSASGPVVTDPSGGTVPQPSEPPVGSREVKTAKGALTLEVYPLRRDGQIMWLTAHAVAKSAGADSFSTVDMWGSLFGYRWQLIDQGNKTVYLPAKAGDATLCSPGSPPSWMKDGDEVWISCAFGVPPDDVKALTVLVGHFGSYGSVPLR